MSHEVAETDGRTDITKVKVAYRNFCERAPKSTLYYISAKRELVGNLKSDIYVSGQKCKHVLIAKCGSQGLCNSGSNSVLSGLKCPPLRSHTDRDCCRSLQRNAHVVPSVGRSLVLTYPWFIHSLVFSLRGRVGRNQSPVMWPVWLCHIAFWASSWG